MGIAYLKLRPKSLWERFKHRNDPLTEPEEFEPIPDIHILTLTEVRNMPNEANKTDVQTVEKLMSEVVGYEFVTASPLDGSSIGVIRTEDVYRAICKAMNVEPTSTSFSSYR